MPHCYLSCSSSPHPATPRRRRDRLVNLTSFLLLGILLSWVSGVQAQTEPAPADAPAPVEQTTPVSDAPPELVSTLAEIDAAASQQDLSAVMNFYSPNFTNSDGLTRDSLQQALQAFWERYSDVTYTTELTDWQAEGEALVAETTTTITGTQRNDGNAATLKATIASRQRFEGLKITEQEILSEENQLTQGQNPPTVEVILPQQVGTGQEFEFDVIVQEPLGDRLLLGAALEEPVQSSAYLNPTPVTLELLSSGGLFKLGSASPTPETRWVSAILIRDDGITTIARRLQIVDSAELESP